MKRITVADLPIAPAHGVCLRCPRCGGEFSATRGDYFWYPMTRPFRCHNDRTYLHLVRKGTFYERINP